MNAIHISADEIERVMQETGMDYIQARNHLIGNEQVKRIASDGHQQALRAAFSASQVSAGGAQQ